jgi:hypothetical protein
MLLKGGVVGLRRGHLCLEQHPAVDRQPAPIEGLRFVRHRDMGVQIRVADAAVAVGEPTRDQATCVRIRARSAAATEASTGSPIAALRAAIRLATSTRNGVASSMILNGAPTA